VVAILSSKIARQELFRKECAAAKVRKLFTISFYWWICCPSPLDKYELSQPVKPHGGYPLGENGLFSCLMLVPTNGSDSLHFSSTKGTSLLHGNILLFVLACSHYTAGDLSLL